MCYRFEQEEKAGEKRERRMKREVVPLEKSQTTEIKVKLTPCQGDNTRLFQTRAWGKGLGKERYHQSRYPS